MLRQAGGCGRGGCRREIRLRRGKGQRSTRAAGGEPGWAAEGRAGPRLSPSCASHFVLSDVKQSWSWRLGLITFNYNNCCLSPVFCISPWGNLSAASLPALLQLPPYRSDRSGPGPSSDASRRINANRPIDWEEWECGSFGGGRISLKWKKVMSMAGNASLSGPLIKCLFIMSCTWGDADRCHLDDISHAHGEADPAKQILALFPTHFM